MAIDLKVGEFDKEVFPVINKGHPPVIDVGIIAAGEGELPAGAVLSRENGKYYANDQGKGTPSHTGTDAILVKAVDATDSDTEALVLLHGIAVKDYVKMKGDAGFVDISDEVYMGLRDKGIYVK